MASGSTGVSKAVDETAPLAWLVTRFTGSPHRTWWRHETNVFGPDDNEHNASLTRHLGEGEANEQVASSFLTLRRN
jgi:hypothetical protein